MSERSAQRNDGGHPLTYLALAAGLFIGTALANAWVRSAQRRHRAESEHEQLRRWEGEGGAVPGAAATPPGA